MSEAAAEMVWAGIMGVGAIIWLLAARSWFRTFGTKAGAVVSDRVTVDQDAAVVSDRIARTLASDAFDVRARIESATDYELKASVRPTSIPGVRGGGTPSTGANLVCRFGRALSGTTVDYTIDARAMGRGAALVGALLLLLGLGAMAAAYVLVPRFVIPNETPAVRWQVVQTVHIMHFLWPPFLVTTIARRGRRVVLDRLADLLSNLPYV